MAANIFVHNPATLWEPNNDRYKCCCQSCHVKTGALTIGIIEASILGIGIIVSLIDVDVFVGNLVHEIIWIVALVCLFWGIKTERGGLLVPHMVLQVLSMILMTVAVVAIIIMLSIGGGALAVQHAHYPGHHQSEIEKAGVSIILLVSMVLILIILLFSLDIWFFYVLLQCYRFFKDKSYHRNAPVIMASSPIYTQQPNQPVNTNNDHPDVSDQFHAVQPATLAV